MKALLALALIPCLMLGACDSSHHIENQAHAISLGLDFKDDEFTMSVQVPTIGADSGSGGDKSGGGASASKYLLYSATAKEFPMAYDVLQATLPQELNLTQLKSIIISESLAESEHFIKTLDELMHVFALSGSAILIVSRSEAKKLIENQKSFIGTRLSITVPSMLDYYAENGYIPKTSLAMLYAGCASMYSTGRVALAGESKGEQSTKNAYLPGEMMREGDNKNEYIGCALFDRQKLAGVLNGRETQLMHFLSGTSIHVADMVGGTSLRISEKRRPDVKVDVSNAAPKIDITLHLKVSALIDFPDMDALSKSLAADCLGVIEKCQNWGVEPFGFADRAAYKFATMEDWQKYDWLNAFSKAEIRLKVRLTGEK